MYNPRFPGQVADVESGWFYNWHRHYNPSLGRYIQSDPIGLNGGVSTYAYVGGSPLDGADPYGLMNLKIPGAVGENSIHANPGPDVVPPGAMAEHDPPHIHLGSNNGPQISTETFEPLNEKEARMMTNSQKKFCKRLSDDIKDTIRKRQKDVFKYGKIMAVLEALPPASLDSVTSTCRQDIFWCAENTPDSFDAVMEQVCKNNKCPE